MIHNVDKFFWMTYKREKIFGEIMWKRKRLHIHGESFSILTSFGMFLFLARKSEIENKWQQKIIFKLNKINWFYFA